MENIKKFSRSLPEFWKELIALYKYSCQDCMLNDTQKLKHHYHQLTENANRFYTKNVEGVNEH